jgi:hypothetical protein
MTPPGSLENCPHSFGKTPLPFDQCTPPSPNWTVAKERFSRFSLAPEWSYLLAGKSPSGSYWGGTAVLRPHPYFGFGASVLSNLSNETQILGRLQTSFNLHSRGMFRATIAALAGVNHLYGQNEAVSGDRFAVGGELALDMRFYQFLKTNWISISPFVRGLYTPAATLSSDKTPSQKVALDSGLDLSLGLRLSFDLFETGN